MGMYDYTKTDDQVDLMIKKILSNDNSDLIDNNRYR